MAAQPPPTKKGKTTLHSFFKPRIDRPTEDSNQQQHTPPTHNQQTLPTPSSETLPTSSSAIERDPGKRNNIYDYPLNKRDEIRRAYLIAGSYQPKLREYTARKYKDKTRHFQYSWFTQFYWLEYSPSTHKAYCFPCFLFCNDGRQASLSALVTTGFDNWKRVQGKECAFLLHIGSSTSSPHNRCVANVRDLMRSAQHIDKVMYKASEEEVMKNRLRLKTSIVSVRWLATGERESGRGANQMTTLQRSGATRWGSHYEAVKSMIYMYVVTCKVLEDLLGNCSNPKARAEICGACKNIKSFDFVFGLHLMSSIMEITDFLYQAFQKESVDILAAMRYVSTVKTLLRELRQHGWKKLLQEVKDFCSRHDIDIPDLDTNIGPGHKQITIEHHYHFDIFNEAIDYQLGPWGLVVLSWRREWSRW